MTAIVSAQVFCGLGLDGVKRTRHLIGEAPVQMRIDERPYAVLWCTPGDLEPLAAGFCLSEGIIGGPGDLARIELDSDGRGVNVVLVPGRRDALVKRLDGRRASMSDIALEGVPPLADSPPLDPVAVRGLIESLDALQPLRASTRAAHAAALYDQALSLLAVAEDVGRHNALDKAVGKLLMGDGFDRIRVLVLSSRISFEMINKAARARAAVVAAVSRPTAIAVDLARRLNMTLATPHGIDGLCVYCGGQRLGAASWEPSGMPANGG